MFASILGGGIWSLLPFWGEESGVCFHFGGRNLEFASILGGRILGLRSGGVLLQPWR